MEAYALVLLLLDGGLRLGEALGLRWATSPGGETKTTRAVRSSSPGPDRVAVRGA